MPITVNCPNCNRALRVPDELLGKRVKCPACATVLTANSAEGVQSAAPPSAQEEGVVRRKRPMPPPEEEEGEEEEAPRPARRRPEPASEEEQEEEEPEEEEEEERPRRRRRRFGRKPHRGGTVLTMGILSLVCIGVIFGPIAWIMGNNDLREMRAGRMDRSGEGTTKAGQICGIIGTVLGVIWLFCVGFQIIATLAAGGLK